jgi:hypothetical protein
VLFTYSTKTPATRETVLKVAEDAQRKYEEDGLKWNHRGRSKCEYFGSVAVWLDLLPQDYYLKVVQGGLTRLFTVVPSGQ